MKTRKRHIIALIVSICAFIAVAATMLTWSNNQISNAYLELLGNQAKNYASVAAQTTHLTDAQVQSLKSLDYQELQASKENNDFAAIFEASGLNEQVDYAYIMMKLPDDEVRFHVSGEDDGYDAPVGTPLNILWLLDVNVSAEDLGADGSAIDETSRYAYYTEEDDLIFSEAPVYLIHSDEWGRHICGYAPIYSEEGTFIGVVGIDLSVDAYDEHTGLAIEVLLSLLIIIVAVMLAIFIVLARQHKRDEMQMQLQEQRYRILIDTTNTLTFDYDPTTDVLAYTVYDPTGRLEERVVSDYSRNFESVSNVAKSRLGEYREALNRARTEVGSTIIDVRADMGMGMRWYKIRFASVADRNGRIYRIVGRLDDIQREKDIERRADRDKLSGVLNRFAAEDRIAASLMNPTVESAFLLIDIDDFKRINDNKGHTEGDMVIKHMGATLSTLFRRDDIVYRLGGDEFAVFLQAPEVFALAKEKAESLIREIEDFSVSLGWDFPVSVSIGVAVSNGAIPFEEMYAAADKVLYESKDGGKNRFTVVDKREGQS